MDNILNIIILTAGFLLISISSNQLALFFKKIHLPLITGLLLTGILAGPYVLKLIPKNASENLNFINDISLAFIAFAAGAELYLKEIRSRIKSITRNTYIQIIVILIFGTASIYFLSDLIPFMQEFNSTEKLTVSILISTIFTASSPSSAVAIINELRAKGPFTKKVIGVTVIKDVLIIILFAISLSLAKSSITGEDFNYLFILKIFMEILSAFILGYLLFFILKLVFKIRMQDYLKSVFLLFFGYLTYLFSDFLYSVLLTEYNIHFSTEPLLICITAAYLITNKSKYRVDLQKAVKETGPVVYVLFFTLIGASLSLDVFLDVWLVALIFFFLRLTFYLISSFIGGAITRDPLRFAKAGWMTYIIQAGVSVGLASSVSSSFPGWGDSFFTIIIAVIIINQIIGPPLFKIAINMVGESKIKAKTKTIGNNAIIIGYEPQSLALARQLKEHLWNVKIATLKAERDIPDIKDIEIIHIDNIKRNELQRINCKKADALVCMLDDDENYNICETAYQHFGTGELITRLHERSNWKKFHDLDVITVEPTTAIVSLLDHVVRSPVAASLILGNEEGQDTVDVEVRDRDLHGRALRDLKLPPDVIIVTVNRKGHTIISHGYTRLRLGDKVSLIGSQKSLEVVCLKFGE